MTALDSAFYYMLGCAWVILAFAVTFVAWWDGQPRAWFHLGAAYAVVLPAMKYWRDHT